MRRVVMKAWIVIIGILLAPTAHANDYTLRTTDYPGAPLTVLSAINNRGQVAGYYQRRNSGFFDPNIRWTGFFLGSPGGVFRLIDVPDCGTRATSMNDKGQVVGVITCLVPGSYAYANRYFIFSQERGLELPDLPPGVTLIDDVKINNRGNLLLDTISPGVWHGPGILVDGKTNVAISHSGSLLCECVNTCDPRDPAGSPVIQCLPSSGVMAFNDSDEVLGDYEIGTDVTGPVEHFFFLYRNGQYRDITLPAVPDNGPFTPIGLGNGGQVIGFYYDGMYMVTNGMIVSLRLNTYIASARSSKLLTSSVATFSPSFTPPSYTTPMGINDKGQVVGYYTQEYMPPGTPGIRVSWHGFIATPDHDESGE